MEVVTSATELPTQDEWVMSTDPNRFVIVLKNDTEFFKGQDRLGIIVRVDDCVGDSDQPNKSRFVIHVQEFRALDGQEPGENLDAHRDVRSFCRVPSFEGRIADALNLWAETITEDQKMEVWLAGGAPDLHAIIDSILKA